MYVHSSSILITRSTTVGRWKNLQRVTTFKCNKQSALPTTNGQAERAVKMVKQLLENSPNPYKALMSYRSTPLPSCGLSPEELLMGRRMRTDVPQLKKLFVPDWPYLKGFREVDKQYKKTETQLQSRSSSPSLCGLTLLMVKSREGVWDLLTHLGLTMLKWNRTQLRPRTEVHEELKPLIGLYLPSLKQELPDKLVYYYFSRL